MQHPWQSPTQQASSLQGTAASFEALFNVLRTITNEATVQYTLALLDELITLQPSLAPAMHLSESASPGGSAPNTPLVLSRLLTRSDWFTQVRPCLFPCHRVSV